jgi:hypothetical protein
MRYDAPILVKRFGPIFGAPAPPCRISVFAYCFTVEQALATAKAFRSRDTGDLFWLEARGARASRPLKARA